jgi:hypothetical protein
MPIRKHTATRAAIVLTAPGLSGWAVTSMPSISWTTNVTISPARNTLSRRVRQWTWRRRINEISEAVMNVSPAAATAVAVGPILFPGISAKSDTARALVNAVSAAEARMR